MVSTSLNMLDCVAGFPATGGGEVLLLGMTENPTMQADEQILSHPWVVIPTYNERENITDMINALFVLDLPGLSVLIIDDNSPDGTARAVENLQKQYSTLHLKVRQKKAGLGTAYIEGFNYAISSGATAIVQMDADFSHDPHDAPRLLNKLSSHDMVIGSRYSHGVSVINWPLKRLILSTTANAYACFVTGMPLKDVTGGFRAWRPSAIKAINLDTIYADGYGFQIVMAYRAWKKDLRITEIPIIFTERREGQSKMDRSIMWEAFILVLKLRLFR